jgi:hypothetical protein
MSFGYSVGDFVLLTQLAWTVVDNSRKACGERNELARETNNLHMVLRRLSEEVSKPDSLLSVGTDDRLDEIRNIARECRRLLRALDKQLVKYNALTGEKRSFAKLWQQVKFGNGMMKNLSDVRLKVSSYTSTLTLYINLLSIGSQGRIERHMYAQGGELREMRHSINRIAATIQASHTESSILTSYIDDDKAVWKQLRRELVKKGFSCSVLRKNKRVIKKYLLELGKRGVLDERPSSEHASGCGAGESSGIARSESSSSGSEVAPSQPASLASEILDGDSYSEASGLRESGKEKERESPKEVRASNIQGDSSHMPTNWSAINCSDTRAKNNVEDLDHHARNTLSSETSGSITNEKSCDKPVPKPAIIEDIQYVDFLEGTHPNCESPSAPSPQINYAEDKPISEKESKEVLESSPDMTKTERQRVTDTDDAPSKRETNKNHKEADVEDAATPCKATQPEVSSQVVGVDSRSEPPVIATYRHRLPTMPIPGPKIVGWGSFQRQDESSVRGISDVDQAALEQNPARNFKTRPPLPYVVVMQAGQKKDTEARQTTIGATNDPESDYYNRMTKSLDAHPEQPRAGSERRDSANRHLKPPRSPKAVTFVVGDRRGRTRAMYYHNARRTGSVYRRPRPVFHPSIGRRKAMYYVNTRVPRAIWQPNCSFADETSDDTSDEGSWVDDAEGPCIIGANYTNNRDSAEGFSRSYSRSRSLPRAATVVVGDGRSGRGYPRGYCGVNSRVIYRAYRSRNRSVRSRSARNRNARNRDARSRSESTSTVYEYERTVYYGRRQARPVYEYDGRTGAIYHAHSRPRTSRWLPVYRPAMAHPSARRCL